MKCTKVTPELVAIIWKNHGDHKRVGHPSKNPMHHQCPKSCGTPKEKHGVVTDGHLYLIVCPGDYIIDNSKDPKDIAVCSKAEFKKEYKPIPKKKKATPKKKS